MPFPKQFLYPPVPETDIHVIDECGPVFVYEMPYGFNHHIIHPWQCFLTDGFNTLIQTHNLSITT